MHKSVSQLYEQDFYAWLRHQAALMRERRFEDMDIDNLAEELESMGRSEKRQLVNRLAVLLMHLLKWQFQPERRSNSWKYTLIEQRRRIRKLLEENPSFKPTLTEKIIEAYDLAIPMVIQKTPLEESQLPATCPYSIEQLLDELFYPR